jgi:hypothetical protein
MFILKTVSTKTVWQGLQISNIHGRAAITEPLITENCTKTWKRWCDDHNTWPSDVWKYIMWPRLYGFFWVIHQHLKFIWHMNFRCQWITQKKAYNVQNTAEVLNQEWSVESSFTLFPTSGLGYVWISPRKPVILRFQLWNMELELWLFEHSAGPVLTENGFITARDYVDISGCQVHSGVASKQWCSFSRQWFAVHTATRMKMHFNIFYG